MATHWKGFIALLVVAMMASIFGAFFSPYLALGAVVSTIVALFVLGTAWMRPRDSRQE
jgi:hypothetical protein